PPDVDVLDRELSVYPPLLVCPARAGVDRASLLPERSPPDRVWSPLPAQGSRGGDGLKTYARAPLLHAPLSRVACRRSRICFAKVTGPLARERPATTRDRIANLHTQSCVPTRFRPQRPRPSNPIEPSLSSMVDPTRLKARTSRIPEPVHYLHTRPSYRLACYGSDTINPTKE